VDLAALDDLVRQLESDGGPNRQTTGDSQGGNPGAVPSNRVSANLQEVAWLTILQLHGFMQDRADTWTKRGIAYRVDPGDDVRREWAQFASLAGHYGQLIGSRIDVLLKQLDVACNTGDKWSAVIDCLFAANASSGNWWNPAARRLATLEYLRDSTADGHMEQFRWLELEPAGGSELGVDESVRAARMLFENNYWTSINRVNASGRGEVRMALVKDDIGNWSLKSFDNNPEDLLQAYRDTTVAGLQALAKVAKKGAIPADGLIGFAASLSTGGLGGQDQGASVHAGVASVRADLTTALSEIEARYSTEIAKINVEEELAATAVTEAETSLAGSNRVIATQEALLASLDVRLDEAARSNAPAERIEELAQEKAQARASLSTAQLERASFERGVIEAKAHSAQVTERRRREGQRAIEMAQLELRAYQRALVAIQKMGAPAQASSPDPPANPLPSMAIR
jgi:hypothetical protein